MAPKINPELLKLLGPLHYQSPRFALALFGAGVIQISGSIAGVVHARNRFGNYMRPRTKPINPNTARQEQVKTNLSYLAEYWHGDLTQALRDAWDVYAAAVTMKNRIGQAIHLTGFNHFIRSSMAMCQFYQGAVDAAPTVLSLPEKDMTLAVSAEDIAAQTFTFTFSDAGWAADGDNKLRILLYQGLPQLASRGFFATPYRYMDAVDQVDGAAGTGTYAAVFPFAEGQKIWFQARMVTNSKRISELWSPDPRIIEADA